MRTFQTREILFEELISELGDKPLFANASDLARKLVAWGLYGVKGKERSLGSYLAQVITTNKRNCPPALKQAILKGVEKRAEQLASADRAALLRSVERAFERDDQTRRSSPVNTDKLYDELITFSETSSLQFIITARTAEDHGTERARLLTDVLLRRTGLQALATEDDTSLLDELTRPGLSRPKISYVFNVPTVQDGNRWWKNLFGRVHRDAMDRHSLEVDPKPLHRAINKLNESRILRVQRVPEIMCAVPTVVFDPTGSAAGFVLFYHSGGGDSQQLSMARMDDNSLIDWMRYAFDPITTDIVGVEQIPYPLPPPTRS